MRKLMIVFAAIAAMQISTVFAIEKDVIDRAKLAFSEQLEMTGSAISDFDWIAEDAVYQYPLNDINVKIRVEGRDAIARHLRALSAIKSNLDAESIRYYPTLDPNVVFVQYYLVPADGNGERHNTIAIIEMRDKQIANFTQLNRSTESLQVLNQATGYFN